MRSALTTIDGMATTELYVAFTMDCERIAAESPPGGPESWETSERAISGFCDTLLDQGITPSLFLTPECGNQHRRLLRKISRKGVELGLHVHPQSLGDHRYGRYLGQYDREAQRSIIGGAAESFRRTFGRRPGSFRPGNFSANEETFSVLVELDFRQGSVSDPGRNCPQFAASWRGSHPLPHWASAEDRLIPGNLPFLEVPLTTDPSRLHGNGFPYELRVESGNFDDYHRGIIEGALRHIRRNPGAFPALCLFTHNYFDYRDPGCQQAITLANIIDYLDTLRRDHEVRPVTLESMRQRFVELHRPQR